MSALFSTNKAAFMDSIFYPDLQVEEGQVTFLTGKSGSGKSTLLKLFNGVVSPSRGEVLYRGQNIERLDTVSLRRRALLCGQSPYLFDKSIAENFAAFHAYRDEKPPDEEAMRAFLALCRADLPLDSGCARLSGGERQRVFIAICLSLRPEALMLDEPTSALDTENAVGMLENIVDYCKRQQITLIVVSHDSALTARFAQRRICLDSEDGVCGKS